MEEFELTRSDVIGLAFIARKFMADHPDERFARFQVRQTAITGTIVEIVSGPALVGEQHRLERWQISGGGYAERTH